MAGHPTYHVNVIKLKREIIWTGGLPHLPGVPHLHVNRPLISLIIKLRHEGTLERLLYNTLLDAWIFDETNFIL